MQLATSSAAEIRAYDKMPSSSTLNRVLALARLRACVCKTRGMPYRPPERVSESALRALVACAELAEEHTRATGSGAYADGFRSAAHQIAAQIARLHVGRPITPLERDLRDA